MKATLSKQGEVTLTANKSPLTSSESEGPLVSQPTDGLQVGSDDRSAVGDYESPFPFGGKIGQVVIERGQ